LYVSATFQAILTGLKWYAKTVHQLS